MMSWLLAFVVGGVPLLQIDGPPIAPVDILPGHQVVELRGPLIARTAGARLVLFVRDHSTLTGQRPDRGNAFEEAVPAGSVTARLSNPDGGELTLAHTGYTYYRGYSGLVLTETSPGARQQRYSHLELDASVALPDVRFVWLDQLTRTVRDVPAPR